MSNEAYALFILTFVLIGVGLGIVIGMLAYRMAIRRTGTHAPTRARIGLQALVLAAAAWLVPTAPLALALYLWFLANQPINDMIVSVIAIPLWVAIAYLCPAIGVGAGLAFFVAMSRKLGRAIRQSNE